MKPNSNKRLPTGLVLLLFFLSGALALVYQVVWARIMTHVFGSTALAAGTVIAAFMAGMAVGAWYFGRLADRHGNCLKLYGLVEIGIALAALLAHLALNALDTAYPFFYGLAGGSGLLLGLIRFLLAFILVMAPTVLMGATLPILTRLLAGGRRRAGVELSSLYAANTFGAVAGVLLTGFYLIGTFGVHVPVYLAVLGNLLVGLAALALARRLRPGERVTAPETNDPADDPASGQVVTPGLYRAVLAGLVLSGFTSFAYEIYWTRSLVFILGNSTYALTTMLSAFLSGIALGGWLVRFALARSVDRVLLFGCIQIALGIFSASALALLFSMSDPQSLNHYVLSATSRPVNLVLAGYAIAFLVMLLPATLIGATFPLVGSLGITDRAHAGASIGRVYALNTAGNVFGALLPGLFLIAWLGIQKGVLLMALINVAVGFTTLLLRLGAKGRHAGWRVALAALLVLTLAAMSRAPLEFQFPSENEKASFTTLYYREGPLATTKVYKDPQTGEKHMSVDGIVIGGTGNAEFKQLLLAHLPKLFLADYSTELSVGLGSGILVGESARHPGVSRITSVEIEPSVVAGAAYFETENYRALDNPAITIVTDDIGNFLRTSSEKFAVITADEKTADEFASNGFSYSLEYYALLSEHLSVGGAAMQWVPTTLPPSQYRMVLRTFALAFPHVQLWYFMPSYRRGPFNTILIGSNEPLDINPDRIDERLASRPDAFASLERYGLTSALAVLPHFITKDQTLRDAVADADLNSFEHPRYEFYLPWDYALGQENHIVTNHGFLIELKRRSHSDFAAGLFPDAAAEERFKQTMRAEFLYLLGFQRFLNGMPLNENYRVFDAALAMAPWNDSLRARIYAQYAYIAETRHPSQRLPYQQKAKSLYPAPENTALP